MYVFLSKIIYDLPVSLFDTPSKITVADTMVEWGVRLNTSFQLALDERFYYNDFHAVNDSRFQVEFFSCKNVNHSFYFSVGVPLNMYFR